MRQLSVFVDRNYLFPALVMLISSHETLPADLKFVIGTFDDEFRLQDKNHVLFVFQNLKRNLEIIEISKRELKSEIGAIDGSQHFGYAAFGRIHLQKSIQDRHVYSDVDVLFYENGFEVFAGTPIADKIGFVSQFEAYTLAGMPCSKQNREFFAGLIYWPHASSRPDLSFKIPQVWTTPFSSHDQALLNLKIGQDYQHLDPHLCQLDNPLLGYVDYKPGIVHYFGNWKPWQATGLSRTRCKSKNCSWTLWFKAEEDAGKLLESLGLGSWFRGLRNASLRGAPRNLRILRRILWAGRLTGTFIIVELLVRSLWKSEKHLIH